MDVRHKFLSKNLFYFFIGDFFPRVISFFLIPFYTSILSTSDYGIVELIGISVALALPIFTLDIQDAVLRFVYDSRYKQQEVLSTALFIILKGLITVGIGCIGVLLLITPELRIEYILFFVWQYAVIAFQNSLNMFCKGIGKVRELTVSNIVQSVLNAILCVLFLLNLNLNLLGYMLANVISSTISLIYIFVKTKIYVYIQLSINKELQKEMLAFSIPLIFSVIAWWINNSSDRYIITWLLDVSSSGLYGVSYKIPNILTMLHLVVLQAWSLSIMNEYDRDDKDRFITETFLMLNVFLLFFCSLLILLNIPLASFLYSGDFYSAWKFVPPLLAAVFFNSTSLLIGCIYTFEKRTKFLSYTTILGAIINIIFNVVFISHIGIYGAALATMFGNIVVMILRLVFVQQLITLHLNWSKNIMAYVLLLIQVLAAYWGNKTILLQLLFFMLLIIIFRKELKDIIFYIKRNYAHIIK